MINASPWSAQEGGEGLRWLVLVMMLPNVVMDMSPWVYLAFLVCSLPPAALPQVLRKLVIQVLEHDVHASNVTINHLHHRNHGAYGSSERASLRGRLVLRRITIHPRLLC